CQFPKIPCAGRVMVVLGKYAAQLVENFVAARILAKTIAQELLGFSGLALALAQPISADSIGADAVRVQLGGQAQPGKDLSHLTSVSQIRWFGAAGLGAPFIEVGVCRRQELAAQGLNPISRLATEPELV